MLLSVEPFNLKSLNLPKVIGILTFVTKGGIFKLMKKFWLKKDVEGPMELAYHAVVLAKLQMGNFYDDQVAFSFNRLKHWGAWWKSVVDTSIKARPNF